MVTKRSRHGGLWTETKRVVDGEVKQVICACPERGAAETRRVCADFKQAKTPCACYCHSTEIFHAGGALA